MELSVVMPAYNEEECIEKVLLNLVEYLDRMKLSCEIVVIDDGSTDRTPDILNKLKEKIKYLRVIAHKKNIGVGSAIRTGLLNSKGERVIIYPADGEESPHIIEEFLSKKADVVVGVRKSRYHRKISYITSFMWRWLINKTFGTRFLDVNWVKMFRRRILDNINIISSSAFIDGEILVKAVYRGYSLDYVYTSQKKRLSGRSKCNAFKIFLPALIDLIRVKRKLKGKHTSID